MKNEITLAKEAEKEFGIYNPSEKEKIVVKDIYNLFRDASDSRNRRYHFFDGLTLVEYIEDSVHRFNTNIFERDDMEDWQASVNDQFTRNKVLAILGKVMQVLPIAEVHGRGEEDSRKGILLSNLYEFVEEEDDYEELMTHFLLETIVKGTGIGYEGVDYNVTKVRNVKGANDNITVTEGTETVTKLYGEIVALEDFYPSSVNIRKIKDMPYCFWRKVIPYTSFLQNWGSFEQSKFVQPQRVYGEKENIPFYANYISDDVGQGSVEIIRYYSKKDDEYVILANGIWLNPIKSKESQEISPLPFNHKQLPFWDVKFDFFGDFFYGKSLPDRLKSLQDVLNVLTNMLLDQSFLTIFPPLLTNGFDSIEDDYLRPGRRTPIDTQGLPITSAFMKLDLGTPSGWHQYILEYTRKIMEESSLDRVSSGNAGVGGRTTAQEIRIAADGVSAILQLFARMINSGIKRKAYLKCANILQFGTDPKSPMIRRVLGENAGEEMNKAFNTFMIEGAVLTGGKRGVKVIEMYQNKDEMPNKGELKARSLLSKADSKKEVEVIAITPQYIRNFQYDIKLIPNPKSVASQEVEKALQLEKVRVYMSFFPDIVDKTELAIITAEKMGDDPAKIILQDILQPSEEQPMEQDPGVSQTPNDNTSNNIARGVMGGEQGPTEMAQLQQQMMG
jgi:hypothetical protein